MLRAAQIYERLPIVWILVGLLFSASGLYLGFEYTLAFWYLILGMVCLGFGVAILVLRRLERPKAPERTRLSPNFISAGTSQMMSEKPAEKPPTPTYEPKD